MKNPQITEKAIKFLKHEIKNQKIKVISNLRNNLTKILWGVKINIGDENVKKRNVFIKNKRIL